MISIEGLTLKVKEKKLLDNINLEFSEGKIYGLIGRNGSGKTLLMKCICGFVRPTEGKIIVNGKAVGKNIDFPKEIGFIIENPGFDLNRSGIKNLQMLSELDNNLKKTELASIMEEVGLDARLKLPVRRYSLGMKQRLGIAQVLMSKPQIMILDEPTNGLDDEGVEFLRKLLLLKKKEGKTIIIASHSKEDIEVLCDETIYIKKGFVIGQFGHRLL